MRTSDRGSAVAEFVFLLLPLIGLASSTICVAWYSFAKVQLIQIASEGAMQLAEPDSTEGEVRETVSKKLEQRLAVKEFALTSQVAGGVATVNLELPQFSLLFPMSLVLPELSEVSRATLEV